MANLASTPNRSTATIEKGIERLEERIVELNAFDLTTVIAGRSPQLARLSAAIEDTLERCFGKSSSAYERLKAAAHLQSNLSRASDPGYHYQYSHKCILRSLELLKEAQRTLKEDLADATLNLPVQSESMSLPLGPLSRQVFVVHGHDDGAREAVARFLEKIGFEAIILHEQANQGRTVIEKIEAHGEVHFAVVLLTPDDTGCVKGGEPEPRARQNVLLELGYFIGRLGRDRVCALKRGTLEIPSDFAGVVWEKMDDSGGWKQALGRELQAAGHEVDWNRVMRP
jgi:predicted nucleotide-binding protein